MSKWAVVIHAWDPYEWAWTPCLKCFEKFFDFAACSNAYFITSGTTFAHDKFKVIPSPGALWTDRLRSALQGIPEEYIMYFQEDMWPHRKVFSGDWSIIFNCFLEMKMNVLRLEANGPLYTMAPLGIEAAGVPLFRLNDWTSDYLLSCQPSFWRKQFLMDNLIQSEEAWDFELEGTKRLRGKDNRIFFYPMDWFYHVIRKGKYVQPYYDKMKELVGF